MTKVHRKVHVTEAWQYDGSPRETWPSWVRNCVVVGSAGPVLTRRSGKQMMHLNEWIVRDLDGEPEWYPQGAFEANFDILSEGK